MNEEEMTIYRRTGLCVSIRRVESQLGGSDACLLSQHSGGRGRQISVSSRPAWSTRATRRVGNQDEVFLLLDAALADKFTEVHESENQLP